MDFKYFSKNGELLPIAEAVVPLSSIEYQYGYGVYETIRVNGGKPMFLPPHLERLEKSAEILDIEHPFDRSTVDTAIEKLVKKIGDETYNLKILLIGGQEPALYIIPLNPHFPDKKLYRDGVSLITYEYQRLFPHAKSLNMLPSYLAYKKAREAGAYDALLISNKGSLTEGTRTNFFCIRDITIISPPEADILPGVTREALLHVAKHAGFQYEERDIFFGDLESSDGAFITSTSSKILPVRSIDDTQLKAKPAALAELMDAFDRFVDATST